MRSTFISFLIFCMALMISGCLNDKGKSEQQDAGTDAAAEEGIVIDRLSHEIIPPAGVRVHFRVLDVEANPVRILTKKDVSVINDEKGEPFGTGGEGGGVPALGEPSNLGLYSVLALDMSDSIFNAGALDDVINGAKVFIEKLVNEPRGNLKHNVAILAFGSSSKTEWISDFNNNAYELKTVLEELRIGESRGGTDLYGSYMKSLSKIDSAGKGEDMVEKFVAILTDGTHEAGNEEQMRKDALSEKSASDADIFSIGIKGNYEEEKIEELASKKEYFALADKASSLTTVFQDVAERADAVTHSNYVVGVCTPVEMGDPTLTIQVDVDGRTGSATVQYSTSQLTGDITQCDEDEIAGVDGDTDTDSDSDTDFCDQDTEVRQPETDFCWRRCPLGQTWDGDSCEGTKIRADWCETNGENHDDCYPDNPGVSRCEQYLDSRYRVPTAEEFSVLLEESELGNMDGKKCNGGDGPTMCNGMFGSDSGWYWSSSLYDVYYAWNALFSYGSVGYDYVHNALYVRCVRTGP